MRTLRFKAPAAAMFVGVSMNEIDGAMYSHALPGGEFVSLQLDVHLNGKHLNTHYGEQSLPLEEDKPGPKLLFPRCTIVGGWKILAKSHSSNRTWLFENRWSEVPKVSHGVQGHIFDPNGQPFIITPAPDQESMGVRYWDPVRGPVLGSPTYSPTTDLARELGVTRLYEWTYRDGIAIGQGDQGGCVAQIEGKHRLIAPGDCRFVQFERAGDILAVAFPRLAEVDAMLFWLTVSELKDLPEYHGAGPIIIDPPPPPPPPPPEKAMFPERLKDGTRVKDFVSRELAATGLLGRGSNEQERRDNAARAVAAVAAAANVVEGREVYGLRSKHRAGWSVLPLKGGGEIGVYSDVLAYRDPFLGVDVVTGAEEAGAGTGWTNEGPVTDSRHRFVAPSELDLGGVPEPPAPPQTHRYVGGGHDTGTCDECGQSRFAAIHEVPESKTFHLYDGGEQDTGLCDICQQPREHALHVSVGPPPPPPPPPNSLEQLVAELQHRVEVLESKPSGGIDRAEVERIAAELIKNQLEVAVDVKETGSSFLRHDHGVTVTLSLNGQQFRREALAARKGMPELPNEIARILK